MSSFAAKGMAAFGESMANMKLAQFIEGELKAQEFENKILKMGWDKACEIIG
jgi:hypothetical protein